jgi:hypothetical protein
MHEDPTMTSRIRLVLPGLFLALLPFAAGAQPPYDRPPPGYDRPPPGYDRPPPGYDMRGRHPLYLHALADLRTVRWLLSHRADTRMEARDEEAAIASIDRAYFEITRAAINDGKDPRAPVQVDVPPERAGRLHKAMELLRQVRSDVARAEEDPYTRGLRDRAVEHIDEAIRATDRAIDDKRFFRDGDRDHDRDHDRYH